MAGEVMKGLFGLDPTQVAIAQDQAMAQSADQMANQRAALGTWGAINAQGMGTGKIMGERLGRLGAGLLGYEDPQIKRARLLQQMAPQLANLPPDQRQEALAKILMQSGDTLGIPMGQDAYKSGLEALKLKMEAWKAQQAGNASQATALEKLAQDPLIGKLPPDKFTPASMEAFSKSHNYKDLVLAPKAIAEMNPQFINLYNRWKAGEKLNPTDEATLRKYAKDYWGTDSADAILNPDAKETSKMKEAAEYARLFLKGKDRTPDEEVKFRVLQAADPEFSKLTEQDSKTIQFGLTTKLEYERLLDAYPGVMAGTMKSPVSLQEFAGNYNTMMSTLSKEPSMTFQAAMNLMGVRDPAQRDFIMQVASAMYPALRLETGAAIAGTEWKMLFEQYLPFAEDSPAIQKRKIDRLRDKVNVTVLMAKSKPGWNRISSIPMPYPSSTVGAPKPAAKKPAGVSLDAIEAELKRRKGG